jgi:hypothetical protein
MVHGYLTGSTEGIGKPVQHLSDKSLDLADCLPWAQGTDVARETVGGSDERGDEGLVHGSILWANSAG